MTDLSVNNFSAPNPQDHYSHGSSPQAKAIVVIGLALRKKHTRPPYSLYLSCALMFTKFDFHNSQGLANITGVQNLSVADIDMYKVIFQTFIKY